VKKGEQLNRMLNTDRGKVISPILVVVKAIVPIQALIINGYHMFLVDPSGCSTAVYTSAKGFLPVYISYPVVSTRVTADLPQE
jgi:hypothetical protein